MANLFLTVPVSILTVFLLTCFIIHVITVEAFVIRVSFPENTGGIHSNKISPCQKNIRCIVKRILTFYQFYQEAIHKFLRY